MQVQTQMRLQNEKSNAPLPVCLPATQVLIPDEVVGFRGWFKRKEDGG